jgi:hypothetical protein
MCACAHDFQPQTQCSVPRGLVCLVFKGRASHRTLSISVRILPPLNCLSKLFLHVVFVWHCVPRLVFSWAMQPAKVRGRSAISRQLLMP